MPTIKNNVTPIQFERLIVEILKCVDYPQMVACQPSLNYFEIAWGKPKTNIYEQYKRLAQSQS